MKVNCLELLDLGLGEYSRDAWHKCIPGGKICVDFYTPGSKSDNGVCFVIYSNDLELCGKPCYYGGSRMFVI